MFSLFRKDEKSILWIGQEKSVEFGFQGQSLIFNDNYSFNLNLKEFAEPLHARILQDILKW